MAEPAAGTNIRFIWSEILTDKYTPMAALRHSLAGKAPHIPPGSLTVHIASLIQRGYASREKSVNGYLYRSHHILSTVPLPPLAIASLWEILKPRVGDHVTAALVATMTGKENSNYTRMLNVLAKKGCLEKVSLSGRCHYIVLPSDNTKAIEPVMREPLPVNEPDIMSMSIGDLFLQAKQLNDENIRLKTTLENIAQLLVSAGIVE